MYSLRPYQESAVESVFAYFRENVNKNPLIGMPTGTGKSVVIAEFCRRALNRFPGTRILMATHRKELIEQNFEKLLSLWPQAPAGIYSAGLKRKEICPITFAGIQTIATNPSLFGLVHLLIVDEAHRISLKETSSYQLLISELKRVNPKLKVVGLTATPYRNGQGMLTDPILKINKRLGTTKEQPPLFHGFAFNNTDLDSFNQLITDGYLAPLIPRKTKEELDVSQVRIQAGEFKLDELQRAVDKDEVTRRAIDEAIEHGADRKSWLIFASGVEHSKHVASTLESCGIPTGVVYEGIARDDILAGFKAGRIRALVNNDILTTGFDHPGIDLIIMLRPTASPSLWVQMLGRGTRPCAGKTDCLVLDYAGNTRRLGPINDPILPRKKKGTRLGGVAPVKCCETCSTWNHSSARICISCKTEFPTVVKIEEEASTAELVRSTRVVQSRTPEIGIFDVRGVFYSKHVPAERPPSIRISYDCGLRVFTEWLCLEHEGYASKRSRDLWRERMGEEPPNSTEEAYAKINLMPKPTQIRVWTNATIPQVKALCYDNSSFKKVTIAPWSPKSL